MLELEGVNAYYGNSHVGGLEGNEFFLREYIGV
jgi:hypothetical protein